MALTEIVFGGGNQASIGLVTLDASVQETHGKSAKVTEHPVEDGSTISDHIISQPDTISINGIVSNHPLVYLASFNAPSPLQNDLAPASERAELAFAELERVMTAGELVDVVTTFKEYESMAIESIEVTRDAARGNSMDATIRLRQVITATIETVAVPQPETAGNQAVRSKGKKPPAEASPQTAAIAENKSYFARIASFFGGG